jgi:hypothetical protein
VNRRFWKINTLKCGSVRRGFLITRKSQIRVIQPLLSKPQSISNMVNKPRSQTPATQRLGQKINKFSTGCSYRTCPVGHQDMSGIHELCTPSSKLVAFDFNFQHKLQVPPEGYATTIKPAHKLAQPKEIKTKQISNEMQLRHDICFTKVRTPLSPTLH